MLRIMLAAALAACTLSGCMTFTSSLGLVNDTTRVMTPYPVVVNPPPPHRAPVGMVPIGDRVAIDTTSFNPLFYTPGVTDSARPNAIFIGLDLYDAVPPVLLYRLFHYPVPPDMLDANPANQPILLGEQFRELEDKNTQLTVTEVPAGGLGSAPEGSWLVEFKVAK